jgi:sigma-B regulation protein RsbU (phosphoserine phosphatase)
MARAQTTPDPELTRLQRAVEELAFLNDLARRLGSTFELAEIMQMVMERSRQAVGAEQAKISLIEADDTSHVSTYVQSRDDKEASFFGLRDDLASCVLSRHQPMLFNDPAHDDRLAGVTLDPQIRNLACVPLDVGGKPIGMLAAFNKRGGAAFDADDQRLLTIIASQSAQVIERARLLERERAAAIMAEELRMARGIQSTLLPDAAPEIPGYELHGFSEPAAEVGGDYFDFLDLGEERWGLAVGDVSGKGVPAALLMANLQATLRGQALRAASCCECVEWCNRLLFRSTTPDKFATLFYGTLNYGQHRLRYCNAGHERPILLRDGHDPTLLETGNLIVGIMEHPVYRDDVVPLEPGDTVVIYSDGVTDMLDAQGELFDLERLLRVVHEQRELSASDLGQAVVAAVRDHAGTTPAADDMTVMVIRRLRG